MVLVHHFRQLPLIFLLPCLPQSCRYYGAFAFIKCLPACLTLHTSFMPNYTSTTSTVCEFLPHNHRFGCHSFDATVSTDSCALKPLILVAFGASRNAKHSRVPTNSRWSHHELPSKWDITSFINPLSYLVSDIFLPLTFSWGYIAKTPTCCCYWIDQFMYLSPINAPRSIRSLV